MIYTLTVNPCVDYHMNLEHTGVRVGSINRSEGEQAFPGGKGLNVSVVLSRLGVANKAWGFAAGKIGKLLKSLCKAQGCNVDFLWLPEGETRINVKLDCSEETAINGKGPEITVEAMAELLVRAGSLTKEDTLVLSGFSQAQTGSIYQQVCLAAGATGARLVVDAQGDALCATFVSKPWLIKPNVEELTGIFSESRRDEVTLLRLMGLCQEMGVRNILLSRGKDGALLLTEKHEVFRATAVDEKKVVSTVGCGDAMVAGYLGGLLAGGESPAEALRVASAAGLATAHTQYLATKESIWDAMFQVKVDQIR